MKNKFPLYTQMSYKEFRNWCSERSCDGLWSMGEAMHCIDIISAIDKLWFWKRNKIWKSEFEQPILEGIVNPIERKIGSMLENG